MLVAFSVSPSMVAPSGRSESGSPDSGSPDSGSPDPGSVAAQVAEAVRVVRESGLPNRTDSMFTTIEGEWDECMAVVKKACEVIGAGDRRVSLVLKADIRPGYTGQLTAKVERVEAILGNGEQHGIDSADGGASSSGTAPGSSA